jgi:hypothetical protein
MSPEEKNVIAGIFDRLKGASAQARDAEAERFIAERIQQQPYAPYVMAQSLYAQEQALNGMQQQMQQMQAHIQQLEAYAQQSQQQQAQGGGFLGGLFGGGRQAAPPPPPMTGRGQMGNAPMGQQGGRGMPMGGPQPGPWGGQPQQAAGPWGQQQRGGGTGFLGTAAMTAAGVAGGMLAANAISSMFSGGAGQAQAAASSGFSPIPPTEAPQQPAAYEEPNDGYQAEPASYDDGSDYGGGGDDWA